MFIYRTRHSPAMFIPLTELMIITRVLLEQDKAQTKSANGLF